MNPSEPRFLVVDDYPDLRRLSAMAIESLGYARVDQAASGEEALRLLRAEQYDFVLSDVNMPGMNGFMLLRTIREDATLRRIPVLLMTAAGDTKYAESALQRGALGCLDKPVRHAVLGPIIRAALSRSAET